MIIHEFLVDSDFVDDMERQVFQVGLNYRLAANLTGIDLDRLWRNSISLHFALPGFTHQTSASHQNRVLRC